jgi:hypothetical protein
MLSAQRANDEGAIVDQFLKVEEEEYDEEVMIEPEPNRETVDKETVREGRRMR